jgi:hypothetical protein
VESRCIRCVSDTSRIQGCELRLRRHSVCFKDARDGLRNVTFVPMTCILYSYLSRVLLHSFIIIIVLHCFIDYYN